VPGDGPSDARRLHEELVVPEPNGSFENLAGRSDDGGVPEQIVKRRGDAPRAERVEEKASRLGGLVRVPFVEEVRSRMRGIQKRLELPAEEIDLAVVEDADAGEKPVAVERGKLVLAEGADRGVSRARGALGDGPVMERQVLDAHDRFIIA
jgi:hypothetical protein